MSDHDPTKDMTPEALAAYRAAEEEIARAQDEGRYDLDLDQRKFQALTHLPPSVANLTELRTLLLTDTEISDLTPLSPLTELRRVFLGRTHVTDLSPLVGNENLKRLVLWGLKLSNPTLFEAFPSLEVLSVQGSDFSDLSILTGHSSLAGLYLDRSQVLDLRPVRGLHRLVQAPDTSGLIFKDTPAGETDPKIAELAEIRDHKERVQALFDYIDTLPPWPEPLPSPPYPPNTPPRAPDPDDLIDVDLTDEKLETAESKPSEAERDEDLKKTIHARLKPKAADLAQIAGNMHPRLATRARSLVERLEKPFNDLDLRNIHMDLEDLKSTYDRRAERTGEEAYSADVVDALADVVETGPGLTLDNPDVEKLETRKRRFLAAPLGPEVRQQHHRFSVATSQDVDAIGPNLRDLEARNAERGDEPSSQALQDALHRNMLIRLGRYALTGAGTIVVGAAGSALWTFVHANADTILPLLQVYGTAFAGWFIAAMGKVEQLSGVFANIEAKPIQRRVDPNRKDEA